MWLSGSGIGHVAQSEDKSGVFLQLLEERKTRYCGSEPPSTTKKTTTTLHSHKPPTSSMCACAAFYLCHLEERGRTVAICSSRQLKVVKSYSFGQAGSGKGCSSWWLTGCCCCRLWPCPDTDRPLNGRINDQLAGHPNQSQTPLCRVLA